ncbi:isochorismatase family protein [Kitasatospora sp. MAP5-34]|uniref:isochorismatase family protein n=1 Tax=Kitasatospora sp. MAP5-34 TaxID=3035102 RepID=UPI00247662F1|nr:isochorismatase family protein [Kitasatospora sp. MAP5-34]MDH6576304.1 isochorismate hydrolase [Kitasatospora sp. MAP5-34]
MGIPAIAPYPMPGQGDLPENTARWTVDPARAVLLIHDMQKYFLLPFAADEPPVSDLLRNVTLLRDRAAELGVPVAYTAQPGGMTDEQRGLLKDFWGQGMTASPEHQEIADPVRPAEGDLVLSNWRYSAFFRTELLAFMRAQGRDQLIVCGVYAHIGVLMTTCDAFTYDVQPFLVGDAVADFSREYHCSALRYAAERCAMTVITRTVLAELGQARQRI